MTLEELQDWLLSDEGIADDLARIAKLSILNELESISPNFDVEEALNAIDWERVVFAGSILTKSSKRNHLEAALRIATACLIIQDEKIITDAGGVLFEKLANHRSVELAVERGILSPNLRERLGISLAMEVEKNEIQNSVLFETSGEWQNVNKFQNKLWNAASQSNAWVSASAPTASGKTFLVLNWLVDTILTRDNARVAVYIAPTRALVSEIETELKKMTKDEEAIEIISLPILEAYVKTQTTSCKAIFVLTQERLHLLANLLDEQIKVDVCIVDEAHKIGDRQRGVILQDAIERISRANPNVKMLFVSPSTQNPEILLSDVNEGTAKIPISSDEPTVIQNLLMLEQLPRKPKLWKVERLENGVAQSIGTIQLSDRPQGERKKIANIAEAISKKGGTLVYVNGAAESEQIASLISQKVVNEGELDTELEQLSDFIAKDIHPKYLLVETVKKGIAFHYGNMPSLVRSEVERLFRSGKIKILVCTSTLIEGVNLSCRTILVRGPKKGKTTPMNASDFWNLAGRAGRWGSEFQGNIVCVEPNRQDVWPNGVPPREKYPIKRETDKIIDEGDDFLEYLNLRLIEKSDEIKPINADKEFVSAYLLTTKLRMGSILDSPLASRHTTEEIQEIDRILETVKDEIQIPVDLLIKHSGISPFGLQKLLTIFREYPHSAENLIPAPPESDDAYDRYQTMMKRIDESIWNVFVNEKSHALYAIVISEWLKGFSLAQIIRARINYQRRRGTVPKLDELIRNTMDLVEQVARFKAPKYFSAYNDILKFHLAETNQEDLWDEELDIGIALEFGVSSKTLLSLIQAGLSRSSSVILFEYINHSDFELERVVTWIKEHFSQFEGMGISPIVIREISEKLGIEENT